MSGNLKNWFNGLPVPGLSGSAGSLKYWFNGLPIPVIPAVISQNITGVSSTGTAGVIAASADNGAIVGVTATGSTGTIAKEVDTIILGVSASGNPGTIAGAVNSGNITGVSASGASGTFIPEVDVTLLGVSATDGAGTITVNIVTPGADVPGISVTGNVGSFVPEVDGAFTGVSASASAGSFTPLQLTGLAGNGLSGSIIPDVLTFLLGSSATTSVGVLTFTFGGSITGASGTGQIGTINSEIDIALTGVQASAQLGTVTTTSVNVGNLIGQAATGSAGTIHSEVDANIGFDGVSGVASTGQPSAAKAFPGVSASGSPGLIRGADAKTLTGVVGTSHAGIFLKNFLAFINGVVGTTHPGIIVSGRPVNVVGVRAVTGVGSLHGPHVDKTLTGVQAVGHAQQFSWVRITGVNAAGSPGLLHDPHVDKKITGVQAVGSAGSVLLELTTTKRFYLTSEISFGGLVENIIPTPAVIGTGWVVGKVAINQFNIMKFNTERAANTFTAISQLTVVPTAITGNSWRSFDPITNVIAAGTWTGSFAFRAVTSASGQIGKVRVRFWKSASSNGIGAVEITSTIVIGTTTGALSTTADQVSTISFDTLAPIAFSNEYLFVQLEWETVNSVNGNPPDVDFSLGANSWVQTPVIASIVNVPGASASGSAGIIIGEVDKIVLGVSAIGSVGALSIPAFAFIPGAFVVGDAGGMSDIVATDVPGAQVTGFVGIAHSQIAVLGAISLVSANGVGMAGDFIFNLNQPVTGVEATGLAGIVSTEIDIEIPSTFATGLVGDIAVTVSFDTLGVEAAGSAGVVDGQGDLTFDGVQVTAQAGIITAEIDFTFDGVSAIGNAGPIVIAPSQATAIEGIEASGSAGDFVPAVSVTLLGISATGICSDIPFGVNQDIPTEEMSGDAGDIGVEIDQFWNGVEGIGIIGHIKTHSSTMDGAEATGSAGVITIVAKSRGREQRLRPRIDNGDGFKVLWYDVY